MKSANGRSDRIRALELAERFVRGGKVQEAIAQYEKILSIDPDDAATHNIIGDLYTQNGDKDKAAAALLRAAEEYEKRGMFAQALAVFKKIYKLFPDDAANSLKLAELYAREGFVTDSKAIYLSAADSCEKAGKPAEAVQILEKVAGLDRDDMDIRERLAGLYRRQGYSEACLDQLNDIAEALIGRGDVERAMRMLKEAQEVDPDDQRTLSNLVEICRKQDNFDGGIAIIEDRLKSRPEDADLLNLLGNLLFEKGEVEKSETVFSQVIGSHPTNVNARIKLGRVNIVRGRLDDAFEMFIPLVDSLVKKHKEDKAIGLLGLILESKNSHLPSLERLASIYRAGRDMGKLEVVDKVILKELRAKGEAERMLTVLEELKNIRPDDQTIETEYGQIHNSLGMGRDERQGEGQSLSDHDQAVIRETLDQADLYLQQGLVRNARRILDNLKLRFPEEPQIAKKISVIDQIKTHIDEEELRRRIEKTSQLEMKFREKGAAGKLAEQKKAWGPFSRDIIEGEKMSTAEIFAETDILPFIPTEAAEFKVHELDDQVREELRMLRMAYKQQVQGEMTQSERDLSHIVEDFKKDLKTKVKGEDYETHFNLGIAFMEQGLFQEALDEFSIAARDRKLSVDCFSMISYCHKQRQSFGDARDWLDKALKLAREGTEQYYALTYDLAELFEDINDADQAVKLFKEIIAWNPQYRNISGKLARFGGKRAGASAARDS